MNKHRYIFSLLFLALALGAGPAKAAERADVPEKYKWNAADLYPDDAAWEKKREELASRIPQLADYQGKLGLSGKRLFTAVDNNGADAGTGPAAGLRQYAQRRGHADKQSLADEPGLHGPGHEGRLGHLFYGAGDNSRR
jgi:hypothetical protein